MKTLRRGKGIPVVTKSHKRGEIVEIQHAYWESGGKTKLYEVRLESNEFVLLTRNDFDFADSIIKWDAIKRVAKASGWEQA